MKSSVGRKILFIQHASALGGSAYSLFLLMRELKKQGIIPEVALARPTPELCAFYDDADFTIHRAPQIEIFTHTTGGWGRLSSWKSLYQLWHTICRWRTSQEATIQLVNATSPDIVHLNSVVLSPSAVALQRHNIPFVWHVRECPPFQGMRTQFIRKHLLNTRHVIFLSEYDRHEWVNGMHGEVMPNFVDYGKFALTPSRDEARKQLGIDLGLPVVLYLGGTVKIKGFYTLLQAIPEVLKTLPATLFLMPNSEIRLADKGIKKAVQQVLPYIGSGTAGQNLLKSIKEGGLGKAIKLLPHAFDVNLFLSACDLLVFPSIMPHFARPVIEASAMGRPVVGSDIGGVRELIIDGENGILVKPGNPNELANAIIKILNDSKLSAAMGSTGQIAAREKYAEESYINKILYLYQRILN